MLTRFLSSALVAAAGVTALTGVASAAPYPPAASQYSEVLSLHAVTGPGVTAGYAYVFEDNTGTRPETFTVSVTGPFQAERVPVVRLSRFQAYSTDLYARVPLNTRPGVYEVLVTVTASAPGERSSAVRDVVFLNVKPRMR